MSRSFCPGKLGGVEFTYRDVLSHFGVRKFQVTRFTPPAENQRNPTCRADCRAGAAAAGWGAPGVGCSCRGAAATAAVKPPLATPPACASHAHGRHRLPIGHDTGLARAVRTLHRSTRLLTCARAFSRRHVGPSLWGVAVLGVNYVSKLVRTRAWYSTFQPVFPTGE
jgi:hypothetical protein